MGKPTFTPAQQTALDISGRDVLVSAAAGSGKTFTLTRRIIKNILEKNADISRIMVVTFTRAAANELKSRITSALMDAISQDPNNLHLQNQLLLVGDADICTIDSFLSRPVRENFEKLGLQASMRIADETEIQTLYNNLLGEVVDSMYQRYGVCSDYSLAKIDVSTPLTDLISLLTKSRDSSDFTPFLIKLYKKLITLPRGVEVLSDFSRRIREDAERDPLQTAEGKIILRELDGIITGALSFYDTYREDVKNDAILAYAYLPNFEDDYSQLCAIQGAAMSDGYETLREKLKAFPKKDLGRVAKADKTPFREKMSESRNEIKSQITKFVGDYMSWDKEQIKKSYLRTAEITGVLYDILKDFDNKIMKEKLILGIYEFSDMPRYMLKLLKNPDGTKTAAAQILSERYDEIYIDEYQDVNEIQDEIFSLLSRSNRFMVGDIKQSIYCFRDADPSFFSHYRSIFPQYDEKEKCVPVGSTVFMSNNFRSDENVIKFSNTVCSPIFKSCGDEIGYKKDDDLVFTKECPEGYISPKVQINVFAKGSPENVLTYLPHARICRHTSGLEENTDGLDCEAIFTANEIKRLLSDGTKSDGKKLKASDIAILVRDNDDAAGIIKALKALGIDYIIASKSQLLSSREMTLLVNLCEITDNPRNDVPLCSVICCEFISIDLRFSTGEIATVRGHSEKKLSLYDAICAYGEDGRGDPLDTLLSEKCRRITDILKSLRAYSVKLSAEKFLRVLSGSESFSEFCTGEAFEFLYNCACTYTKNVWNGLSGFVKYFKNLTENGKISGEVSRVDNCVNIVTMHSSKGLQYNTCFLYRCADSFNEKELNGAILYDKELCVGMQLPEPVGDGINIIKKDTLIYRVCKNNIRRRLRAEGMRLLYVALTRAEERLYISGSVSTRSTYESFFKKFSLFGVSHHSVFSHSSFMSWVMGALMNPDAIKDSYELNLHSIEDIFELDVTDAPRKTEQIKTDAVSEAYARIMRNPPSMGREDIILSSIPAKAAASKASPGMLDDSVFSSIPSGILFAGDDDALKDNTPADNAQAIKKRIELMRSTPPSFDSLLEVNKKPTASERGTAMHLFLQYCDYENIKTHGVECEIERLLDKKFISKRTSEILYVNQLKKFFESDFFEKILDAKNIRREFKFGMFRSASDFTQNKELSELVRDRKIYIQGSIDLIIENRDGSIYVCDYKTDRVSPEEAANPALLRERMRTSHKDQLEQYKYAVQKIFNRAPDKIFILSLSSGLAVEI